MSVDNHNAGLRRLAHTLALGGLLCMVISLPASANPRDGIVKGGDAAISESGKKITVQQNTDRAVIDWRSFNIAPDEHTDFKQPTPQSMMLNRVKDVQPSFIDGKLTANGNIFVVNPNGIVFGQGSAVDVSGLVASTADIGTGEFMSGKLVFDRPGNPNAAIINNGSITAKDAGLVGLVAPTVVNNGIITANMGRAQLSSGDTATVDLYGDGLMEVEVSDAVTSQLVENNGIIAAEGGKIALTAAAGKRIVNSLVKANGELRAPSVMEKNGEIYIYGDGSDVEVSGVVAAKGMEAGEKGGSIDILGEDITILDGARVNASGRAGGGTVQVGGAYRGAGTTPTAKTTRLEQAATIRANAFDEGDGGQVVLWSDESTDFLGNIYARGGVISGNGGLVETSGHNLLATGSVNASSTNGTGGLWLLDPEDITINQAACTGTNCVSADDIATSLSTGTNVTIATDAGTGGNGDITVNGDIAVVNTSGAATVALTLEAHRNIIINDTMDITSTGKALNLTLNSDADGGVTPTSGAVSIGSGTINTNGGSILMGGGTGAGYAAVGNVVSTSGVLLDGTTLNAGGGNITLRGQGYAGGSNAYGVFLDGANVTTTGNGNIVGVGVGGGGGGSSLDRGFYLLNGAAISVTGAGSAGGVTITGTGGVSGVGVKLDNGSITTTDGSISITGTGVGASENGLSFEGGSSVSASGIGNITITGIGPTPGTVACNGNACGIYIYSNISFTTVSGSITINSQNGALFTDSSSSVTIGGNSTSGAITLAVDGLQLTEPGIIKTSGALTVKPYTATTAINIGSNTGGLDISNTYLGYMNLGTASSITFGDATNTGAMNINTNVTFSKPVSFLSGSVAADITVAGNLTSSYGTNAGTAITISSGRDLTVNNGVTIDHTAVDGTTVSTNLLAKRNIVFNGSSAVTSTGGVNVNLTLNSDSDGGTTPADGAILLEEGTFTTSGGNILIGGGTGAGYAAVGNVTYTNGVLLDVTTLNAGGGNITLRGQGYDVTDTFYNSNGIVLGGNGSITTTGTGAITLIGTASNDGENIGVFIAMGTVSVVNGALTITGNGGANATGGLNYGVFIENGNTFVESTGTGDITITGTGGANGGSNEGVHIGDDGTVRATAAGGDITIIGTGGTSNSGSQDMHGIVMNHGHISTTTGSITLDGTAGNTSGSNNTAVIISWSSDLISTSGNISITAETQGGGGQDNGVNMHDTATISTGGSGTITITSTIDNSDWRNAFGMHDTASIISANGNITISGIATDAGDNVTAFYMGDDTSISTSGSGTITLTGSADNGNATSFGLNGSGQVIGGVAQTAAITLIADDMVLGANTSIRTSGALTVKVYTLGTTMGIAGSAVGDLNISDAELGYMNLGTASSITFGDATNTGDMDINNQNNVLTFTVPVTFTTGAAGADISFGTSCCGGYDSIISSATGNAVTVNAAQDILIYSNLSSTNTSSANFILNAGRHIAPTNNGAGVTADGSGTLNMTFRADSDGNGVGGFNFGTGADNMSFISNGGNIIIGGGNGGAITAGSGYAKNVGITGGNTNIINAGAGNIIINGQGSAANDFGVYIGAGWTVQTTSGNITINGLGDTTGGAFNTGVRIDGSTITSAGGNILATGVAGLGTGDGVQVRGAAVVQTSGTGNIELTGTGNSASGVWVGNTGAVYTDSGHIYLTSITGSTDFSDNAVVGDAGTSGAIVIIGDTMWAADSPTIRTSGAITLKPYTLGTTMGVGDTAAGDLLIDDTFLSYLRMDLASSTTFGDTTNTAEMDIDSGFTFNGPAVFVNKTGSDIYLNDIASSSAGNAITIDAGRDLMFRSEVVMTNATASTVLFKAKRNIIGNNDNGVHANGAGVVNITLNSDSDAVTPADGYIYLGEGLFDSNGGNIILGGGTDPANQAATSNDNGRRQGISFFHTNFISDAGTVTMRGQGLLDDWNAMGIAMDTVVIQSTSGNISVFGTGGLCPSGGCHGSNGIMMTFGTSITSGSGNITVVGTGGTGLNNGGENNGISLGFDNQGDATIASDSGTISVTAIAGDGTDSYGIQTGNGTDDYVIGDAGTSGAITIIADSLNLAAGTSIQTTGALTVKPYTLGRAVNIGSNTGGLDISTTYLGYMNLTTASGVTFGDGTNTGAMNINSAATFGHTSFLTKAGSNITVAGALTSSSTTGNGITLTPGAGGVILLNQNITTSNANVTLSNAVTLGAASVINAGTGTLTFGSTVNGGYNFTNTAATFSFGGAWGGSTPLAAVILNSTNNITLPAISAASVAVTTSGGSADITLGGNLATTGNGAALTLTSGRDIKTSAVGTASTAGTGAILFTAARDILFTTHDYDLTSAGSGAITLRANNNIDFDANGDITSTGGIITLNSDRDAIGDGYIFFSGGSDITSNGGNIIFGGGGTPSTGYAKSQAGRDAGVTVSSTVNAGGGDITMHGSGGSNVGYGVALGGGTLQTNGNGAISIWGLDSSGESAIYTRNQIISTANGAITLTGSSTGSIGLNIQYATDITSTGGAITLDAHTGAIRLEDTDTIGGDSATGPITLIGDAMTFGNNTIIKTTGAVTVKAYTDATTIGLAGGTGDLNLDATELGYFHTNITSLTFGSNTGDGAIAISNHNWDSALTILSDTGNVTFTNAAGNLDFDEVITVTTDEGNVSFVASGDIVDDTDWDITTQEGNVTFNSDSDGNDVGAIHLDDTTITTTTGNILMGGDTNAADYAYGNGSHTPGIFLANVALETTSGNVTLRGHGGGADVTIGVRLLTGVDITTVGGAITITGVSGTNGNSRHGVEVGSFSTVTSTTGAIAITGTNQGGSGAGIYLDEGSVVGSTGSSSITLTAIGGGGLAAEGNAGKTIGGASATGNITIITDALIFDGGAMNVQTTGAVTVKAYTDATTIGLAGGTGDLNLSATELGYFHTSITSFTFGSNTGDGAINISNHDWNSPLTILSDTGNVTFTNAAGSIDFDEVITVTTDEGNITFSASRNIIDDTGWNITTGSGAIKFISDTDGNSEGYISLTGMDIVSTSGSILMAGGDATGTGVAYAEDGNGMDGVLLDGTDVSTGGSGTITMRGYSDDESGVAAINSSSVVTAGGAISLTGAGAVGVYIDDSDVTSTTGNISLQGDGDGYGGIYVLGTSTVSAGGSGTITLAGTSQNANIFDGFGVKVGDSGGTNIFAEDGNITITGTAGGSNVAGVAVTWFSDIYTTGDGNISITGDSDFDDSPGVMVLDNSYVYTTDGDISLTGTGGSGNNNGVSIYTFAGAYSENGNITLTGTAGADGGNGVFISNDGQAYTDTGNVTVTGIRNGGTTTGILFGAGGNGNGIGNDDSVGNITLITDTLTFNAQRSIKTAGALVIRPYTSGTSMLVGTNTGSAETLQISDTALGYMNLGSASSVTFGGTTAGAMEINTAVSFANPVTFRTGATYDINLTGNLASSNTGAVAVVLASGDDFINGSSRTITTGAGGRWVIYSEASGQDTKGGLTPAATIDGETFGTLAPGAVPGTTNTWVYSSALGNTITFTADIISATYGNTPVYTYTFACSTGCLEDDVVTGGTISLTSAGINVGSYAIDASVGSLTFDAAYNGYTITFVDRAGGLTINARNITLTANNISKTEGQLYTFNGTEYTVGGSGLATGDTISTIDLASDGADTLATIAAPGPTYAITIANAIGTGGFDATNYNITYTDGTMTLQALSSNPPCCGNIGSSAGGSTSSGGSTSGSSGSSSGSSSSGGSTSGGSTSGNTSGGSSSGNTYTSTMWDNIIHASQGTAEGYVSTLGLDPLSVNDTNLLRQEEVNGYEDILEEMLKEELFEEFSDNGFVLSEEVAPASGESSEGNWAADEDDDDTIFWAPVGSEELFEIDPTLSRTLRFGDKVSNIKGGYGRGAMQSASLQ